MELTLKDGRHVSLEIPPAGACPSFFLVSLPKAGSTLFYKMMRPISQHAGAAYFSLPNVLHDMGVPASSIAAGLDSVFEPIGYAYGGFRGIEEPIRIPGFADRRTIVLVRDPRDMLTSLYFSEAISHRPPGTAVSAELATQFEARRKVALEESIEEFVLRRGPNLRALFMRTLGKLDAISYKLYRYEDIIFDKTSWIEDMLDYLDTTVPKRIIEKVVARHDVKPVEENVHAHVRRVSPGDHKDKLSGGVIEQLNELFSPILARFSYSLS